MVIDSGNLDFVSMVNDITYVTSLGTVGSCVLFGIAACVKNYFQRNQKEDAVSTRPEPTFTREISDGYRQPRNDYHNL